MVMKYTLQAAHKEAPILKYNIAFSKSIRKECVINEGKKEVFQQLIHKMGIYKPHTR